MRQLILKMMIEVLHRVPIKSGLTRLSFNAIVNWLMAEMPTKCPAQLRDGRTIEVSTSDYHGRILYLFGTNDPKVEQTANALLRAGDVFLDIGANYSSIGLSASHFVAPHGEVHLFEPQRQIADRVQKAIESGNYRNVHLHRLGLLDRDARLTLRYPANHSGVATFANHQDANSFELVEECEVRNIETYVRPLVSCCYFGAKVDIEGAEPQVLPWLLSQPNLRFVIFEAAHNQKFLYDAVHASGLVLYGLRRHPLLLRIDKVEQFAELLKFHDLVAIRVPKGFVCPSKADPKQFANLLNGYSQK
jgi:FkbM family methyltransferase